MSSSLTIVWFRQDLRLGDNPALSHAASSGKVLPVYILDDANAGEWAAGGASRWWLHNSLESLNRSLAGRLKILRGNALELIPKLANEHQASAVCWNRCYEPWRRRTDELLKARLHTAGIQVESFNASLLWEPWQILKPDRNPYKVFTAFYKNGCLTRGLPRPPLPAPQEIAFADVDIEPQAISSLALLPSIEWYKNMAATWTVGEQGANRTLHTFLQHGLHQYRQGRDFPAMEAVSRLSPYLHHGEISPYQIWHAARESTIGTALEQQQEHFQRELIWREFSYYLLYHFSHLPEANLQTRFDHFPWSGDLRLLEPWQKGLTGYPIVDAGMRELWQTGYMHNRVRMIVGSFLVKNLLLHWRHGQKWFWDCLVDADLASNSASWQWVAGSGADAAPYFRIFNPVLQGMKFDPDGTYVRRYVPELARLPDRYLHDPSRAPQSVLNAAQVRLDRDYPSAIVDLAESRAIALSAYKSLSSGTNQR